MSTKQINVVFVSFHAGWATILFSLLRSRKLNKNGIYPPTVVDIVLKEKWWEQAIE